MNILSKEKAHCNRTIYFLNAEKLVCCMKPAFSLLRDLIVAEQAIFSL